MTLFSVMGAICQVDKKHSSLVRALNSIVDQGDHTELLLYLLDKSLTDQSSFRNDNINNVSYALKCILTLKSADRQGILLLMT